MKDLKKLLNHTRKIIDSDKKYLEKKNLIKDTERTDGKVTYEDYIRNRINDLDPIITNLENQLRDTRIPIYLKNI